MKKNNDFGTPVANQLQSICPIHVWTQPILTVMETYGIWTWTQACQKYLVLLSYC